MLPTTRIVDEDPAVACRKAMDELDAAWEAVRIRRRKEGFAINGKVLTWRDPSFKSAILFGGVLIGLAIMQALDMGGDMVTWHVSPKILVGLGLLIAYVEALSAVRFQTIRSRYAAMRATIQQGGRVDIGGLEVDESDRTLTAHGTALILVTVMGVVAVAALGIVSAWGNP